MRLKPFPKKTLIWALVLLLAGGLISLAIRKRGFVEVRTEKAKRQRLELTVTATSTGTVKSDKEVKVSAERTGRLSKLLIDEGDPVKAGQLIAGLDPEDASLNLEMASASYERASALLDELKAAYEPFMDEVENAISRAQAILKEAQQRFERMKGLKAKGFVSQMEFDKAELDYSVSKANHESALSGRKHLDVKVREIKAQEAAVKEASRALALARLDYERSFIRSPVSGVVAGRPATLGETVIKGAPIALLITLESLYIEAPIDEADIARVRKGQDVHVTMDAYPEKRLSGYVHAVSPVVLGGRLEARTFEVKVRLRDKGIVLKPGMSADVEIVADRVGDALTVPSPAVIERAEGKFVYVREGARVRLRQIETGISDWTYTEVKSGLGEGDEVVVTPDAPGLRDGARVKAIGSDNRT